MQREPPLAVVLARQPGTKESRYAHLLSGEVDAGELSLPRMVAPLSTAADQERISRLEEAVAGLQNEVRVLKEILGSDPSAAGLPPIASLDCAFRRVQQGRALRLIIGDTNITTDAGRQAILRAIARARDWYEQITTGQARTIGQLVGLHRLSPRFIRMHMKLVQLGPQAIETMIRRPHSLPLSLTDLLVAIPMKWGEQLSGDALELSSRTDLPL